MKKYLYMITPILSFGGAWVLVPYTTIRFARNRALRKEYGTKFTVRLMIYAPFLMIPILLVEQLFQNRVSQEVYAAILFSCLYVSGVIATKLLCNWLKKVGI